MQYVVNCDVLFRDSKKTPSVSISSIVSYRNPFIVTHYMHHQTASKNVHKDHCLV